MLAFILLIATAPADAPLVPPSAKLEKLWSAGEFTEGPAQAADGCILFTDIGNRIMKFDPATGKTTEFRNPSGRANGLDFDPQGRLVACEGANKGGNRRISITEKDGKVRTLADNWNGKKFNSPNDVTVDTKGRVYFTDPRYVGDDPREIDLESVYRVDPDGKVTRIITDVQRPNGIILSPDMKTLYLADSNSKGNRHLLAFPLNEDGSVGDKKVLFDFKEGRGIDGMAIDTKGNIWATAGTGDKAGVWVFNPAGEKIGFIPTPEPPTNCVFGGAARKMLYVTAGRSLYRIAVNNEGFAVFRPKIQKKAADTFISAADAGPDFAIQGEYEGTLAGKDKFAAQVVALGDGKFDVYFLTGGLPGAGWDVKGRVKASASTKNDAIALIMPQWSGELKDGALTGKTADGEAFSLKRVERQSPTVGAKPPDGAKILFDGKNADAWGGGKIVEENLLNCGTNSKENFGYGKLHIEFRTPFQPKDRGQGRGNSGVYLMGREIQVLDSFGLEGKNDECGGFYGSRKPDVNMCLPPLTWQTYDVEIKPTDKPDVALVTVLHNGVKIHENYEMKGARAAKINLQNHGNPVVYRNIWFVSQPPKTS